jgi:putative membrane protein
VIPYDPKRWWRVLLTFPRSPIFTTLLLDVVIVGLYAALVVWIETDVIKVAVPLGPAILSLLGIILGLLLVFRTNTAYDRWWEGRKLWGQLVNQSRALARQLHAALPPGEQGRRALYARVLTVFPGALAFHLRGAAVAETVPPGPLLTELVQAIHDDVAAGNLARETLISLTPLVAGLDDVMGACERIRKTPIPFSYSTYIKWFVVAFALLIPFALAPEFGYGTVVAAMFLFFSTMGIELLAGELEEPFGTDSNDLPLEDIAATITRDVRVILGDH